MDKASKLKFILIAVIVIIVILLGVYFYGYSSKPTSTVTITNDEGGVSTATPVDTTQATKVAQELYNAFFTTLLGIAIPTEVFSGQGPFDDLAALSNVQFALCFSYYNNTYNRSLLADLNSAWTVTAGSAINSSIQRAQTLGITT